MLNIGTIKKGILIGLLLCSAKSYSIDLIVHPETKIDSVSMNIARAIFSGRMKYWSDGTPVRVVMLNRDSNGHNNFCREALNIYPRQLARSWEIIVFSGGGEGPLITQSYDELADAVRSTKGSIGYIEKENDLEGVKVVKFK